MRRSFFWIFPPFGLSISFVLNLFSANADKLSSSVLLAPLIVVSVGVTVLFCTVWLVLRNLPKASLLSSLFVLLFFSYGHVFALLAQADLGIYGLNRFLLPLWFLLGALPAVGLLRYKGNLQRIGTSVGLIVLMVLGMSSLGIPAQILVGTTHIKYTPGMKEASLGGANTGDMPDIYYIILDAHARADVLRDVFGYDNGDFIDCLTKQGFYVAEESLSNYPWTFLSIPSSLNMRYVDNSSPLVLSSLVQQSEVVELFRKWGYKYITFSSGYWMTDNITAADIHYDFDIFNDFDQTLIRTTLLEPVFAIYTFPEQKRQNFWNTLSQLEEIPRNTEATFTFVHVLVTHIPYVFNRNGTASAPFQERWSGAEDRVGIYLDQIAFVDQKICRLVDRILKESDRPPVIIIQSDHGPAGETDYKIGISYETAVHSVLSGEWSPQLNKYWKARLGILNAYYLPDDKGRARLYKSISPVNSFRIIADTYLGTEFGMLEDRHYFSVGSGTQTYDPHVLPMHYISGSNLNR